MFSIKRAVSVFSDFVLKRVRGGKEEKNRERVARKKTNETTYKYLDVLRRKDKKKKTGLLVLLAQLAVHRERHGPREARGPLHRNPAHSDAPRRNGPWRQW